MKPAISVIIVSHKRPLELERALYALMHQTVQNFQVIIVADQRIRLPRGWSFATEYIEFRTPNISQARNLGILSSTAPIVAFCDDDAIPDPNWLERLSAPFYEKPEIGATTGFVRGRNGITYQWKAIQTNRKGQDKELPIKALEPNKYFAPRKNHFIKTVGTNCAFLRAALHEIGGFDEGFFYFHDDSDVNLRLQSSGYHTAIIPKAEVIHHFYESRGRASNRVPKSLYNIGASHHLFLRKHYSGDINSELESFRTLQRKRLLRFFHLGLIRPKQINGLMRDLNQGIDAGATRESTTPLRKKGAQKLVPLDIKSFETHLDYTAPEYRRENIVNVFLQRSLTARGAVMSYSKHGYWKINYGRFGQLTRNEPWWKYRTRKNAHQRIQNFVEQRFYCQ